jgi:hypothetical protein
MNLSSQHCYLPFGQRRRSDLIARLLSRAGWRVCCTTFFVKPRRVSDSGSDAADLVSLTASDGAEPGARRARGATLIPYRAHPGNDVLDQIPPRQFGAANVRTGSEPSWGVATGASSGNRAKLLRAPQAHAEPSPRILEEWALWLAPLLPEVEPLPPFGAHTNVPPHDQSRTAAPALLLSSHC